MKNWISILLVVISIICCAPVWAQDVRADRPLVAVVNKTVMGDPFLVMIEEEVKERGKVLGFDVIPKAAASHGRVVVDQQLEIVEEMIARRVDGIFLLPADSTVIAPAVKRANAAGIPVITLDTAASGGAIVTHIGTDNVKGSILAAEALIEALRERGIENAKVAMIEGDAGQQTAIDRRLGFHDRMAREPWIKVVASEPGDWSTAVAAEVMEKLIKEHPELDGVYVASDMMGVAAAQVIARFQKTDRISLVTYDGLIEGIDLVKNGKAYADIAQHPKRMGRIGAEVMASILIDEKDPSEIPPYIDSGVEVVKKANVARFLEENWPSASAEKR